MRSLLVSVILLGVSIFWIASARHVLDPNVIMNDLDKIENTDDNEDQVDPQLFRNFMHVFRKKFLPKDAYESDYYDE